MVSSVIESTLDFISINLHRLAKASKPAVAALIPGFVGISIMALLALC
jgi:hypothetical protein